jgi:hypothetical protein
MGFLLIILLLTTFFPTQTKEYESYQSLVLANQARGEQRDRNRNLEAAQLNEKKERMYCRRRICFFVTAPFLITGMVLLHVYAEHAASSNSTGGE